MSGASRYRGDNRSRLLRADEKALIRGVLGSSTDLNLDAMKVFDADDGGMGSIKIEVDRSPTRVFGSELARLGYTDADGVHVSITLNLDNIGDLFEIDFWKIDFSPLISYPTSEQLKRDDA